MKIIRKLKNIFQPSIEKTKIETIKSFTEWLENKKKSPKCPLLIQVELSNICNLKCAMCNTFSPFVTNCTSFESNGFLDYKYIKKLVPIFKNTLQVVLFGYGEPLIYPQWEKMVKIIGKYRVFSSFFTNAMNMDESMSRLMVDNHMGRITISFSGAEKDIYENIYIGGNFEKVLKNIKYLVDYRNKKKLKYPIVSINSLGFQDHIDKFDKFVKMMGKIGVNEIRIGQLIEYASSLKPLFDHAAVVRPEIEGTILEKAKKIAEKYGVRIIDDISGNFTAHSDEEYKKMKIQLSCINEDERKKYKKVNICDFKKVILKSPILKNKYQHYILHSFKENDKVKYIENRLSPVKITENFFCSQPFMTADILQNGMVKTCCNMPHSLENSIMLGDLDNNNFDEIWNGNPYRIFRKSVLKKEYPKCACSHCLAVKSYPNELSFIEIMHEYLFWYKSIYRNMNIAPPIQNILNLLEQEDYKSRMLNRK